MTDTKQQYALDEAIAMAEYHGIDPAEARAEYEQVTQCIERINTLAKQPTPSWSPLWDTIKKGLK